MHVWMHVCGTRAPVSLSVLTSTYTSHEQYDGAVEITAVIFTKSCLLSSPGYSCRVYTADILADLYFKHLVLSIGIIGHSLLLLTIYYSNKLKTSSSYVYLKCIALANLIYLIFTLIDVPGYCATCQFTDKTVRSPTEYKW